ncbi:receptor-like kinase, partial [Trifolium medium]|nr:receptor-like kinase [Trifolium medium]
GLGVRRLREFNLALLGKWCWRLLVDREGFWFRVLAARYGVERGRLRAGGVRGSSWWREIVQIRDGGGELGGGWFGEYSVKRVGDWSDTFCWTDPWVEGTPLCERFRRLFDLAENKSASVAEMFSLGWGTGVAAWAWHQQLRAWKEEQLGELMALWVNLSWIMGLGSADKTVQRIKHIPWESYTDKEMEHMGNLPGCLIADLIFFPLLLYTPILTTTVANCLSRLVTRRSLHYVLTLISFQWSVLTIVDTRTNSLQ